MPGKRHLNDLSQVCKKGKVEDVEGVKRELNLTDHGM